MAEKKYGADQDNSEVLIEKAKDFWGRYGKVLTIVSVLIILVGGGWYAYKNFFKEPKEKKAAEMIFKAEEYYRADSIGKALNGDGQYWGFLKVIQKYGGTKAANQANFYAGSCYIKLNENEKALRYLKKFKSDSKPAQARAYKLMADAYGDLGRNKEAFDYYKKAARHFEKDEPFTAECLFMAAYLAQKTLNDPESAKALYRELFEKYPKTQFGRDAENYLAQLGVYSIDN
jgi:tetratricopeptide (TPR) repeat protein